MWRPAIPGSSQSKTLPSLLEPTRGLQLPSISFCIHEGTSLPASTLGGMPLLQPEVQSSGAALLSLSTSCVEGYLPSSAQAFATSPQFLRTHNHRVGLYTKLSPKSKPLISAELLSRAPGPTVYSSKVSPPPLLLYTEKGRAPASLDSSPTSSFHRRGH